MSKTTTKHQDGIDVYKGLAGAGKGKYRARLWVNGRIKAWSGEAYVKKSKAQSWARETYNALGDALGYND